MSFMSFSCSSYMRFLVVGESDGDAVNLSYHSGEPKMTSQLDDSER